MGNPAEMDWRSMESLDSLRERRIAPGFQPLMDSIYLTDRVNHTILNRSIINYMCSKSDYGRPHCPKRTAHPTSKRVAIEPDASAGI